MRLEPHPPLTAWYGEAANRTRFVRTLFDRTASHYDRANALLSLGSGARYRREALRRAGLAPGMRVLDVAVGTGLVAREAARLAGDPRLVLGLDPSPGMLAECRGALGPALPLLRGRAEALPVADASVDLVSMGYALRHLAELGRPFREFHRVLRPGGRLLVLEKRRPRGRLAHALARLYLRGAVPMLARLTGGGGETADLFRYYWDTVENCVPPPAIMDALRAAGFAEVTCEVQLGLFCAYTARRPEAASAS